MRTEKEEELLALENYWKERLATQEAETVNRQKLTEQEVSCINQASRHVVFSRSALTTFCYIQFLN